MSGHSKWSTIKRKKGAVDAKRGKIFSKLAKEISVAAKIGGEDPDGNPRLRTVREDARGATRTKDNVGKAVKKGAGTMEGVVYEEARYEAYGPGGGAIIIEVLTDNKNRTVADVRHAVTKYGGSLAENGAVTWNFESKGYVAIAKDACSEDEIFGKAIEAGGGDGATDGDMYEIFTEPTDLHAVVEALEGMRLSVQEAKLTMIPKTTMQIEGTQARTMLKLMDKLEDCDDDQNVFANFDLSEEAMAEAMAD